MVFDKEFSSQIVPEWEEAYMDYKSLKALLRDLQRFTLQNTGDGENDHWVGRLTTQAFKLFRNSTTPRKSVYKSAGVGVMGVDDLEEPLIPASTNNPMHQQYGLENVDSSQKKSFTPTASTDEGGKYERLFFKKLDEEFNKVNEFYKDKVDEVTKEADLLHKQMDVLIVYRQEYAEQNADASVSVRTISTTRTSGRDNMNVTHESEHNSQDTSDDEPSEGLDGNHVVEINQSGSCEDKKEYIEEHDKLVPVEILNRVTIKSQIPETHSFIDDIHKIEGLTLTKENVNIVEEQLKHAYIQFYQKLQHLKSYSFMNLLAFSKIMKRYDKITSKGVSRAYLNMLDKSYLGSSDDVSRLREQMESKCIKHFSHTKGMNIMRPKRRRQGHITTTFSLGFLSGCSVVLVIALVMIIRARNILDMEGRTQYMNTMFPLYSFFIYIILHMLLYGGNIYFWRAYKVNYAFIFGFKQGHELGYREIFLISAGLTTLAMASVLANLDMEIDVKTKQYTALTEMIPLASVSLLFLIIFCPFNIIYRSSRFYMLKCAFHTICSGLYKVTLPDFFFADQLTSQAQALRSLQFYICYYAWGDFKLRKNNCDKSNVYITISFILTMIPFWFRMLQCLRRLFEEKDRSQGYNALKYFSIIVAVLVRRGYSQQPDFTWWVLAWVSSVIAGGVSAYWDVALDWGLLQRNSKNPWLRDKLLVKQKSVYFIAMILDVVLRFAWLETVLNFQYHVSFLHEEVYVAIVACLEIIRRGSWNFFRLENEHLNNVGHYRAFVRVPLPYNYEMDEEDKSNK